MPRLCLLDGIVIWINTRDHFPAHFHARLGADEVRVELDGLRVMSGRLSPAKQRLLMKCAAVHRRELVRNWELAQRGLPHEPISSAIDGEEE
ncbi:MAG: DUF4160 domain-containing protein [Actinomycetes bacterium]